MFRTPRRILAALALATVLTPGATGADLAAQLRGLDPRVLPEETDQAQQPAGMLGRDVRARLRAADDRESQAWQAIRTRADWENYRNPRLQALRVSLGEFPRPPRDLQVRVTRRLEGDGYRVENLVFESRPGVVVTANLYLPARPGRSMPGILICHSHHNPKTQD